ncbi:MAG: LysM peptidoglycan-binding domain-containing protein [Spirochaetia bacterium]|nr:LysM peptidoglycan-binding domain-containing protein [Spirochaetia bacterium]
MKHLYKILILPAFFSAAYLTGLSPLYAVGGISTTKLEIPSADPFAPGQTEFEFGGEMYRAKSEFNEYSHRKDLKRENENIPEEFWQREVYSENSMGFLFIAGLFPRFEAGFGMSYTISENNVGYLKEGEENSPKDVEFGELEVGMKYLLSNPEHPVRFALQAGLALNSSSLSPTYDAGIVMTWDIMENMSLDLSGTAFQTSSHLREGHETYKETGYAASLGIGYQFGNFQPVLELNMSQQYSWRLRNYRYPHFVYRDFDMDTSKEINLYDVISADPALEPYLPQLPDLPTNYSPLQERVKYWEKVYTVSAGFSYAINDTAGFLFIASQDVRGVNTTAGRAIALAFNLGFGGGGGDDSGTASSSEPSEQTKTVKKTEKKEKNKPQAKGVYEVKRGDTWWKIAESELGEGKRFYEIKELNPDVKELSRGMKLNMPE